jgi:mRNA interferase RelE/StbE
MSVSKTYNIVIKPLAEKDLKTMPKADAINILNRIMSLETGLKGDIKKLTDFTPEYRLRAGKYRALFEIENDSIIVYRVIHRKESYR